VVDGISYVRIGRPRRGISSRHRPPLFVAPKALTLFLLSFACFFGILLSLSLSVAELSEFRPFAVDFLLRSLATETAREDDLPFFSELLAVNDADERRLRTGDSLSDSDSSDSLERRRTVPSGVGKRRLRPGVFFPFFLRSSCCLRSNNF
jgi:hypothetical protein